MKKNKVNISTQNSTIIVKRCWRLIGQMLRRETASIVKKALHWTPDGKRRKVRPRVT